MMLDVKPHNTAIARSMLSRPTWEFVTRGLISESESVLDYGCGWGADVQLLAQRGFRISGYDPHPAFKFPEPVGQLFDTVMSNYVVNVILTPAARAEMVLKAWGFVHPGGRLILSARSRHDVNTAARTSGWGRLGDGWRVTQHTFQVGLDVPDLVRLGMMAGIGAEHVGRLEFKHCDASAIQLRKAP